MELFQKIPWSHDNQEYEIRIMFTDRLINILAFKDNYPLNGFRYQIQMSKNSEVQKLLNLENFEHIIEMVKDDIKEDRWNKLLKQH